MITKILATAAAAVVVSVGGVSFAASTGALPSKAQAAAHNVFGGLPPAHGNSAHAKSQHAKHATGRSATHGTPSPSLVGLCQAYNSGVAKSKGKALDNPAFTVLITAAGGQDQVDAYCLTVLAGHPSGPPATRPSGPPATHPTGPPAAHPTGPPVPHPTGSPTATPGRP